MRYRLLPALTFALAACGSQQSGDTYVLQVDPAVIADRIEDGEPVLPSPVVPCEPGDPDPPAHCENTPAPLPSEDDHTGRSNAYGHHLVDGDPRSYQLLVQACEGGRAEACLDVGFSLAHGRGVAVDYEAAVPYLVEGCEAGHAEACHMVAWIYGSGEALPINDRLTTWYLGTACDLGRIEACADAGHRHQGGVGTPPDHHRAASLFEPACDAGDQSACRALAEVVVADDPVRAEQIWQVGCVGGEATSCVRVGELYYYGEHVEADDARALRFIGQACALGDATACHNVGVIAQDPASDAHDLSVAVDGFVRGCELGLGQSCVIAHTMLVEAETTRTPMDGRETTATPQDLADAACLQGATEYCAAGVVRSSAGRRNPLFDLSDREGIEHACVAGDDQACVMLADLFVEDGTPESLSHALELYHIGCQAGIERACNALP